MDGNNRCLPDERKGMHNPGEIEENPCQSKEDALAWDRQLCPGQRQWKGRRQPQVQWGRKESKRTSETPPGTWQDGAQRGSLCYPGP